MSHILVINILVTYIVCIWLTATCARQPHAAAPNPGDAVSKEQVLLVPSGASKEGIALLTAVREKDGALRTQRLPMGIKGDAYSICGVSPIIYVVVYVYQEKNAPSGRGWLCKFNLTTQQTEIICRLEALNAYGSESMAFLGGDIYFVGKNGLLKFNPATQQAVTAVKSETVPGVGLASGADWVAFVSKERQIKVLWPATGLVIAHEGQWQDGIRLISSYKNTIIAVDCGNQKTVLLSAKDDIQITQMEQEFLLTGRHLRDAFELNGALWTVHTWEWPQSGGQLGRIGSKDRKTALDFGYRHHGIILKSEH